MIKGFASIRYGDGDVLTLGVKADDNSMVGLRIGACTPSEDGSISEEESRRTFEQPSVEIVFRNGEALDKFIFGLQELRTNFDEKMEESDE